MFEVSWSKEPLEMKYRMVDVDTLICVACQEFLSLIIATDKWQEKLFQKAKECSRKKPTADKDDSEDKSNNYDKYNKYTHVYETMKDLVDLSQFNVINLDLTLINEIVWNCPELIRETNIKTKSRLSDLLNDRNENCHSDKHETPEELYNRGINHLNDLKRFVQEVEKRETESIPDDNDREAYRKKYINLIKALKKTLNEENKETTSPISINENKETKSVKRTSKLLSSSADTEKAKTHISDYDSQIKKSGLTVGGVPGSKKMRLGRVHTKKKDSPSTTE